MSNRIYFLERAKEAEAAIASLPESANILSVEIYNGCKIHIYAETKEDVEKTVAPLTPAYEPVEYDSILESWVQRWTATNSDGVIYFGSVCVKGEGEQNAEN